MRSRYWVAPLALGLAGWLLLGDFHPPADAVAEAAQDFTPRYRIEGLRLLRTGEGGEPVLSVQAASADYFDDGSAELRTVEARGLSGAAAPWQLQAPRGLVPVGQPRMELLAPVTGSGQWPDGERFRLEAAQVWLDDGRKQIESAQPVRIESASRSARAQGFSAPFDARWLQLDQVEMRYALAD